MHLANALGTPVVGIFGPTNPVRTGPVFEAPKILLQPENAPVTGGVDIKGVEVSQVMDAVQTLLG